MNYHILILLILYFALINYTYKASFAQTQTSKLSQAQIEKIQEISVRIDKYKVEANAVRAKLLKISQKIKDQIDTGFSNGNIKKVNQAQGNLNSLEDDITKLQLVIVLDSASTQSDLQQSMNKLKEDVLKINTSLKNVKDDLKSVL